MTIAYLRKDLVADEQIPPVIDTTGIVLWKELDWNNARFEVITLQGDYSHEFNLWLWDDKEKRAFWASSIDFEFEETK